MFGRRTTDAEIAIANENKWPRLYADERRRAMAGEGTVTALGVLRPDVEAVVASSSP
jgi:hypothetical protein